MHSRIRTLIAAGAALAAVAVAAPLAATAATSADSTRTAAKKDPRATPFALRGWGYGTAVKGGRVPAGSGATAAAVFGCTNRAGVDRSNHLAKVAVPQLGTISGVRTRVWTTRQGKVVSAWAQNSIGDVVLSDSPLGTLLLEGVTTTARAYHDGGRFRTATNTDLVKLRFKPPIGPAQTLGLPAPGRPITIPGIARVTIAHSVTGTSSQGASASANGLKVELLPTRTTVNVAHAVAIIGKGVRTGLFSGRSYALGGRAAGDIVNLGRNPLLEMPCPGTSGKLRSRSIASADLGQAAVGVAKSEQQANQTSRAAYGFERSRVASINLGHGQLRIEGIVGQVNVSRSGKGLRTLRRTTTGTTVGKVYVGGQVRELPSTGVLQIPGVAKLQTRVTRPITNGLAVTALRITLLDGSGAVIDLGNAQFAVRRAAR
jgi:hypothetical protein